MNHSDEPNRRRKDSKEAIRRHRKRAQLITQVSQSVQLWLADSEDETLCTLTYSHIEMVGSGEHLCVVVHAAPGSSDEPVDLAALQHKLNEFAPDARMEVARNIHRKRVPLISFLVVPH